ncbi:MAG: tetratricopeptide repeat protein [Verrucomicrobiales bacterium]
MMVAKKTSEAITYMESLRSSKFKGNFFPFEKDLADAYADAGRMDDARAGYMRVTEDPKYPDALRAEAKAQLLEIARLDAVKAGYALLEARQYKTAMAQAIELLGRYPNDPETKVFHAQALTANNRFTEALPILENMRDTAFRGSQFPGWDALAECLQATGRLSEAKAALSVWPPTPRKSPMTRWSPTASPPRATAFQPASPLTPRCCKKPREKPASPGKASPSKVTGSKWAFGAGCTMFL